MKAWGRRIRGAIGMGLIWGAAFAIIGSGIARLAGFNPDVPFPILFAPLGFIVGVIFSAVLVGIERGRGFDRTSLSRFAMFGAASGLLFTGMVVAGAAFRGASLLSEFLLFGPPLSIAGAICATGSLAAARRAERRELSSASFEENDELNEREKRELLGPGA